MGNEFHGKILYSFWFNRFQVFASESGGWYFRDWLKPSGRELPISQFSQYDIKGREQGIAFFKEGFLASSLSSIFDVVQDAPLNTADNLFWQFPCKTEAVALQRHRELAGPVRISDEMHIYLGLPWATWIDFERQQAMSADGREQMERQIRFLKIQLSGIRCALLEMGIDLKVHTVCQHIYWRDFLSIWELLGVTDLWLSHCPSSVVHNSLLSFHPWHLYAVNIEDSQRHVGVVIAKDISAKKVLASFDGAHMPHYLSDIRLRLTQFEIEDGFVIRIKEKWHFDDVVYQHQIGGRPLEDTYSIDSKVIEYNSLLSDSVFSLCPAGAGPNTLRLWESLAVGAIPVLLGDSVRLPKVEGVDWGSIIIRIEDHQFPDLPGILRRVSLEECRRRQYACIQAYAKVKMQTCF